MSNELTVFTFTTDAGTLDEYRHPIRTVTIDGEPWFVAVDVRKALGIASSGTNFAFLDDDEMTLRGRASLGEKVPGRPMAIISESGLYKLILRSDKPEAKAFQNWVTKVVLPAIRKDGAYPPVDVFD